MAKGIREDWSFDLAKIGFAEWNLNSEDKLQKALGELVDGLMDAVHDRVHDTVQEMIKEGIDLATKEYECEVYLGWSTDCPDGDVKMLVDLPLGENDTDYPTWSVSFKSVIEDAIEWMDDENELHWDNLKKVRALLGGLVDCIDQKLAECPKS